MNLIQAMRNKDVMTENGMAAHSTTNDALTDLFYNIGSWRQSQEQDIVRGFISAFGVKGIDSMKILFWSRDVLQGAGERRTFRTIIKYLAENHPQQLRKNLHLVPEFGRFDDLLVLVDTQLEVDALNVIKLALDNKHGLAAKWMPRKGNVANKLRKHLGLTPKQYRKLLVGLSNTVEQKMCARKWSEIVYEHVPSLAMKNYRKAFGKQDQERFGNYIKSLEKGEAKVNSKALYPHNIVNEYLDKYNANVDALLEQQWKSLPNFMEGGTKRILPVVDVSGSMMGGNPSPMSVAVALGLYISERNQGPFQNAFITFSEEPKLQVLNGKFLCDRVQELKRSDWGMSTNLELVFDVVLRHARDNNVPESEMPDTILLLSDMQFNHAVRGQSLTAMEMIKKQYEEAGYKLPNIVFWNLRSTYNMPVKADQSGAALVSGFSPSIMTSILSGQDFTPYSIMRLTIDKERYSAITV